MCEKYNERIIYFILFVLEFSLSKLINGLDKKIENKYTGSGFSKDVLLLPCVNIVLAKHLVKCFNIKIDPNTEFNLNPLK